MRGADAPLPRASRQAVESGTQLAPVTATRRPHGARAAKADLTWARSTWRARLPTVGRAANGGFMRTTSGRTSGSRSRMRSALCRVADASGKISARRPWRTGESSFRCSRAGSSRTAAGSAARTPVPAEGSSTVSPARTSAARKAAQAIGSGVENWSNATWCSLRCEWVGSSAAMRSIMARNAAGESAASRMARPQRRRNSTVAASAAS